MSTPSDPHLRRGLSTAVGELQRDAPYLTERPARTITIVAGLQPS